MTQSPPLAFLAGPSPLARQFREQDWRECPIGDPQQWPQSLRSVVNLMLGSAFPMFVAWGPGLTLLYNDSYAAILGDKHPQALGRRFLDVWSDIAADIDPLVLRAMGGEAFFIENLPLRINRRGFHEDTWFTFSYSPVLDDQGVIAGFYCACTETTAMVLAERRQRQEQERLHTLFQQAPGFVAVLRGPNHVFEIVNDGYRQLTGYRDVLGKPVAKILPEAVEQGFIGLLDQVRSSGVPYVGRSARFVLARGEGGVLSESFLDFVYQPLLAPSGEVDGIFVLGHDVTEQKRAQEALLVFSDSIPAIAWTADARGNVEHVNAQWGEYTGLENGETMGQGWARAIHPDDVEPPRQAFRGGAVDRREWQFEFRLRRHDGAYRWFMTRAVPQLDSGGEVLRWFGTCTDIEEARQVAQALRQADRQKDEFLATLAHELRNPLAPIRTAVHLLAAPASTPPARSRAIEVIGRQVNHMARLLDDLIDIARITQQRLVLKKEWISVQSLVDAAVEAARPLIDAKRQRLSVLVGESKMRLEADPVRLAQVLTNLLNNASKYTDAQGEITLDVRLAGEALTFAVTDNGIGMAPDAVRKIFEMFAQEQSALERSEGGLGIGLALAKGLVELHGGQVAAHSDGPGRGSRFEVTLPQVAAQMPEAAGVALPPPPAPGPTATGRTILLADDNRDAVDLLAELLRLEGHEVVTAHDGLEAVELAAQRRPQVLILDIGMPGLNGYEVARQVRAGRWQERPLLIAATGWGQQEDRERALAAGFDLHLTKPFDPAGLSALFAEHLS